MKKYLLALFSVCLTVLMMSVAFADKNMPADAVPLSTVLQNLQTKGYTDVRKVDFEKGAYEVKAIDQQGMNVEMKVDPKTGNITQTKTKAKSNKPAAPTGSLTALDVAKKVEQSRYHAISELESDSTKYEVKALDSNNKKVKLDVDKTSGQITPQR